MATESRTLVFLALIANTLIAVVKFGAAAVSGSSAMLAEGFHSVADTGNQVFLLRGSAVSRYAPTAQFPFGRGKELYFWSFMVAVFLFVGGAVVAFLEGLDRVRHPAHDESGILFSLIVLGIAALLEIFLAFRPALKEFNRVRGNRSIWSTVRDSRDPALLVVVFEDSAAVLGLVVAAAGIVLADVTGWSQWDGIASIAIAVLLAAVAWILAIEMKALLVGESATRHERSLIRSATLSVPQVRSIGRLLTMQLSPKEILVNMDVELDEGLTTAQAEEAIDEIEAGIKEAVPNASRIFVELESER
ncbi:MAG: cation diffusion facilitator family transporter [Acidimicrobiia bacterium]